MTLPAALGERAAYVVTGTVSIDGTPHEEGAMVVFDKDAAVTFDVAAGSRVMLLGGAAMPEPRHIWWNFVSSRLERIEQAKQDWAAMRFERVPGDDEFIPLPE